MSYCCSLGETEFRIPKDLYVKRILEKLNKLLEDKKIEFDLIDEDEIMELFDKKDVSILDIFNAFLIYCEEYDDYYEPQYLQLDGKLTGAEVHIYGLFAEYVPNNSYVTYYGEDGEQWRYIVKDNEVVEVFPKIVYPEF